MYCSSLAVCVLVYYVLFIISLQARAPLPLRGGVGGEASSPLPREGLGVGLSPSFGGVGGGFSSLPLEGSGWVFDKLGEAFSLFYFGRLKFLS